MRAHNADFNILMFKCKKVEIRHLPPYSPNLNLIEMMWIPIKNKFRRVSPKDAIDVGREISNANLDITPAIVGNWFKATGYVH